ncbi:conserved exported hypothetical protein [Bradyrhizobium sp. ORS 375]|uniref:hypothetical protein n=1 Tax=Bradyrhizobium sp. (strain ORS 375) TaxID=566679 RepID=UPI0002406FB9|nr:hypothetical protein [Bradyrhizobium sp. ORS 375]CCD95662.1 conserved exported hypothetical protein [Bradyrhizobium sp. ORS 375]
MLRPAFALLMPLAGLVLSAPALIGLSYTLRASSPDRVVEGILLGAAAIGPLLVCFAIRLVIPRRHG